MKIDAKTITNVQVQDLQLNVEKQVLRTIQVLRDKNLRVGFAESCTGGLLASLFTQQAGVSDIFWGSVVSYSNEAKHLFLNVSHEVFNQFGAVSYECAAQMAEGLQSQILKTGFKKVLTVSLTGVAGPIGGSVLKPVGTVFIAVSGAEIATQIFHHEFIDAEGQVLSREQIQWASVQAALKHVLQILQ